MVLEALIEAAKKARDFAYAPYSGFAVGAAVATPTGEIFSAVAAGCRQFSQIVIVADSNEAISPCGACRQVLAEFAPDLEVVTMNLRGQLFRSSMQVLLPRASVGILDKPRST